MHKFAKLPKIMELEARASAIPGQLLVAQWRFLQYLRVSFLFQIPAVQLALSFFQRDKNMATQIPPPPQYDSPGDEPLAIPARLTLEQPFQLDRGLVKRLRRREVNAKEAFTIRDASGAYYRSSLKECDEQHGLALP